MEEEKLLTQLEITNYNIQKIRLLCKVSTIIIVFLMFISNVPIFRLSEQVTMPLFLFFSIVVINVVMLYFVSIRKVQVTKYTYKKIDLYIGLYVTLMTTIGAFVSNQDFENYHQFMVYTLILLICCSFLVLSQVQVVFALIVSAFVLVFGLLQHVGNIDVYQQIAYLFTLIPIAYFVSRSLFRSYLKSIKLQVELVKEAQINQELTKKLRIVNRKLELQVTLDPLTNLYNRRGFNDYMDQLKVMENPYSLTMIMIDIDHFKSYNDTYGHSKGDDVLVEIGKLLSMISEEHQLFVSRWGGEEFSIVLFDRTMDFVEFLCDYICVNVRNLNITHSASSAAPVVSVSIGASTQEINNTEEIRSCLEKADELLYAVKVNGRNGYIHNENERFKNAILKVNG